MPTRRINRRKDMGIRSLPIGGIRLDFQRPENLLDFVVQEYVASIEAGEVIPPVQVCFDGKEYWLKDGFHRVEAMRSLGRENVEAEVSPGTLTEMEAEFSKALQEALKEVKEDIRSGPKPRLE